ncbi:MAG: hypothetical protein K9N05_07310 [Candidatus Marinimicrobia bacterium]|nr:hypothetical protein [Candidatus Neomarinimicrobiota bacterium]
MNDLGYLLKKGNISHDKFESTGLKCQDLIAIKESYIEYKKQLDEPAKNIVSILNGIKNIHSLKYRLKKPDDLIIKIIRKKINKPKRIITIENYQKEITDLIGVRALYLFKSSWLGIHTEIRKKFMKTREKPTAYFRKGDPKDQLIAYKSNGCKLRPHDDYYRSVHYLINFPYNKDKYIAEIQIRTIFEEGWSEIDHALRYPNFTEEPLLNQYLSTFNRIAGTADEMGTIAEDLKYNLTLNRIKEIKDNTGKISPHSIQQNIPGNIAMTGSLYRPEIPSELLEAIQNYKIPEIPKELLEKIQNFKIPEIPKELLEKIQNFKFPKIPEELLKATKNKNIITNTSKNDDDKDDDKQN